MAEANPYSRETSNINTPNRDVEGEYGEIRQDYNQSTNNNLDARYFVIDSINDNGGDRNLITPSLPDSINTSRLTRAPVMSNLTTPSTGTPLFPSRELLPQQSQDSLAFTNDTNHASVGINPSPSPEPEPMNVYLRKERARVINNVRQRLMHEQFYEVATQPQFRNQEVTMYNNNLEGKAKLGVRLHNYTDKIHSLYIKYHDTAKRKFF
jgi:hypothetical protein